MADIAINFPGPDGTAVDAFLARELAEGRALGSPVASSTVAGRHVEFSGLAEGETYVATDGSRQVRFAIEAPAVNEIAARLESLETAVPQKAAQADLAAHTAASTSVHGIATTSALETQTGAAAKVAAHEADTTSVHGIANTSALAVTSDARFPTSGQKDALAGTSGSPASSNAYVTNADLRLFAISVKASPYNAVGDGATNDQAAIQAAINAANGRPVHIPAGTYRINSPLRLKPSTYLFGTESPQ
jgi:hypothetical protein